MLQDTPGGTGSKGGGPNIRSVPERRSRRIFRFGVFELRSETGELSKNGIRVRVQAKPIQVLEALLARPGELLTREELCKKLWPAGTFVDFENGLNTATNRLRAALCDSAEAPRYIETLPRLGYRFICPVAEVNEDQPDATKSDVALPVDTAEVKLVTGIPNVRSTDSASYKLRKFFDAAVVMIVVLTVVVLASAYIRSKVSGKRGQPIFKQLTFRAGVIGSARFAPDQKNVVYTAKWGVVIGKHIWSI